MSARAILDFLHPARWYPAAFTATYVLLSFSATPNPLSALWRPLVLGLAAALAVQLIVWAIIRNQRRSALAAAIIVLALLATWVPLMVVAGAGLWLVLVGWLRRRTGQANVWSIRRLTPLVAIFAWALTAVAAAPVAIAMISEFRPPTTQDTEPSVGSTASDTIIILLDGYPRGDSQREQFGIDPAPFANELGERGFRLSAGSRSNYTSTWMTLTSMVYGRYVSEIEGLTELPEAADQYRLLMRAIRTAPLVVDLRRRGYEIVTVPPPYESATLTSADRILAPPQMTSFELALLQHSLAGQLLLGAAPDFALEQHRGRVEASLELLDSEMAMANAEPRLIFVHLLAPHAPIAYRRDGENATPADCFPECPLYVMNGDRDWDRYADHLSWVNTMVLDAVDRARAISDDATIILMSDHGSVRSGAHEANAFRSFFAASVPDGSLGFPDDVSPVDVLRILIDAAAIPTTPYRAWISEPEKPMSVTPFDAALP